MPDQQPLTNSVARERVLRGASRLADAVRRTLGPNSRRVLVQKKWGRPIICHTGVATAREVELTDSVENLGVLMLRRVAERTRQAVGDGTTTSMLLAHAIFAEGIRNIASGASAVDLKRGLDRGLTAALERLKELSRPVQTRAERMKVAAFSARNDRQIGELVVDAVERVGAEAVITVEVATTSDTAFEVVTGLQFDQGYLSPYFAIDSQKMELVLEDPYLLFHEKRIRKLQELLPLLERLLPAAQPLVVIAGDVEGEALTTLVVNKLRGTFSCAAVKAPGLGEHRRAVLEELAILTGGRLLTEESELQAGSVTLETLGRAKRVLITRETTTIIGGYGKSDAIQDRCERIREQIQDATADADREELKQRLVELTRGIAVVCVGGSSTAERENHREAIEDAVCSIQAASQEGIVPGGGLSLLRLIDAVEVEEAHCDGDERTGLRILKHALQIPTRQIAENSAVEGEGVVDKMRFGTGDLGFDAARGEYVDLVEAGIIDPAKVVRVALENAVSAAGLLLLMEATFIEVAEARQEVTRAREVAEE